MTAGEAARLDAAPGDHGLPTTGTTPPINTTPPITLPNLPLTPPTIPYLHPPLNPANPTIDPTLANPTGDEEKKIFHDPVQENPDDILDLHSQDGSTSKNISGVKEFQPNPPEDDASSAKKSRKGNPTEPPLNE